MIFLWVFGNAICGVMPSFLYFILYLLSGVMSGGIHYWVMVVPMWGLLTIWFLMQLFSMLGGPAEVAYWGHIGGFVSGVAIGLLLIKFQLIDTGEYDNPNLIEIFTKP